MAHVQERMAKNRCLLCSNDIEKSNLGSMCNPCKDKMYKYPFMQPKKAEVTKKSEAVRHVVTAKR